MGISNVSLGARPYLTIDGTLVSDIVIGTTQVATDTIDCVATDTWGNTATSTRVVIVEANPNVATTSPSDKRPAIPECETRFGPKSKFKPCRVELIAALEA